jgi:hypothetical protein
MKVKFKNMLHGYTGKADEMIYYMDSRTGKVYARRQFELKNHPAHKPFRQAQQQIYQVKPSSEYQYNLHDYCLSYNQLPDYKDKPIFTWCQVYNKLMWAMQKTMPDKVDLKTITREQIYAQNLPCRTLKDAIDAGLLPAVEGYERWNKQI